MNPTVDAFLRSWPNDPWLVSALVLSGGIYLRGWWRLRARDPVRWHAGRLAAYLGGLLAIFLAIASPIDAFASLLLSLHMTQHLLLMMVAPPLIWLGNPLLPMLWGMPAPLRTGVARPLLRSKRLAAVGGVLVHPLLAWPLFVASTWLWHTPRGYELALTDSNWHLVEHACFLLTALLFWYPVVRPFPARPRWSLWLLVPYLILADVQNTVLAAWLTFSGTVIYPYYERVPRIAGLSALDDQAIAGALMWVPGSIAFLLPLFWIGVSMLLGRDRTASNTAPVRPSLPIVTLQPSYQRAVPSNRTASSPARFDLLRVSLIREFLRWRYARRLLQGVLFVVALMVVIDGLSGPQLGAMNLAGVLPWIHWRGFLVLGLLVAGNFFCMACPFTLPRTLARRWFSSTRSWPRMLRNKWLAIALLIIFLWSYEAFSLWDSPWLTAWITVGYFGGAFAVDSLFRAGSFCKYVCPIGQFNFVQSLVSPLEVTVREPAVCASCRTHECLRGSATIGGCETHLFQPRKQGNLDCTFCLDCARSCPHENVGVLAVMPVSTLWKDGFRSGIGRFSRRFDLAALVILLSFGALSNAAAMVGPVVAWQEKLAADLSLTSPLMMTTIYYVAALLIVPAILITLTASLSRLSAVSRESLRTNIMRYSYALVPLGFSIWLAHYSFHLLTSYESVIPTTQRFVADHLAMNLGAPNWQCACCQPVGDWLLKAELLLLDFGLLLSLYTGYRIAENDSPNRGAAMRTFMPWGALTVVLFAAAVWIVFQPMQMRGTLGLLE